MCHRFMGKRIGRPQPIEERKRENAEISDRAKALDENIVNLSPENSQKLANWLTERVHKCIHSAERSDALDRIKRYREAYEKGVQRTDARTEKGWHDYRSFEAASQADGIKGRIINVFTENPVVKIEGRNALGVRNAPATEKFVDYHHDENIKLGPKGDKIAGILSVEGHVVFYAPWLFEIKEKCPELREIQLYEMADATGRKERWVDVNSPEQVKMAAGDGFKQTDPPEFNVKEIEVTDIKS